MRGKHTRIGTMGAWNNVPLFGSVRTQELKDRRIGNLCPSVHPSVPVISCLEHSIFIFLAEIFKQFSQYFLSFLSNSYFIGQTEPKILCLEAFSPKCLSIMICYHYFVSGDFWRSLSGTRALSSPDEGNLPVQK